MSIGAIRQLQEASRLLRLKKDVEWQTEEVGRAIDELNRRKKVLADFEAGREGIGGENG